MHAFLFLLSYNASIFPSKSILIFNFFFFRRDLSQISRFLFFAKLRWYFFQKAVPVLNYFSKIHPLFPDFSEYFILVILLTLQDCFLFFQFPHSRQFFITKNCAKSSGSSLIQFQFCLMFLQKNWRLTTSAVFPIYAFSLEILSQQAEASVYFL